MVVSVFRVLSLGRFGGLRRFRGLAFRVQGGSGV